MSSLWLLKVQGVAPCAECDRMGTYLRLIDFVYHSTLGVRVIMKKKGAGPCAECDPVAGAPPELTENGFQSETFLAMNFTTQHDIH